MSPFSSSSSKHIPRSPNAFICFRSQFVELRKASGFSGPGCRQDQNSKLAGQVWNNMSLAEKQPYIEMAERMKHEHMAAYPDYKFKPNRKGLRSESSSRSLRASSSQRQPSGSRPKFLDAPSPTPVPTFCHSPSPSAPSAPIHHPQPQYPQAYSERHDAWRYSPPQFGIRNVVPSPDAYPQTIKSEPDSELNLEEVKQEQDFSALCDWDSEYDFSTQSSSHSHAHNSYYRSR